MSTNVSLLSYHSFVRHASGTIEANFRDVFSPLTKFVERLWYLLMILCTCKRTLLHKHWKPLHYIMFGPICRATNKCGRHSTVFSCGIIGLVVSSRHGYFLNLFSSLGHIVSHRRAEWIIAGWNLHGNKIIEMWFHLKRIFFRPADTRNWTSYWFENNWTRSTERDSGIWYEIIEFDFVE